MDVSEGVGLTRLTLETGFKLHYEFLHGGVVVIEQLFDCSAAMIVNVLQHHGHSATIEG